MVAKRVKCLLQCGRPVFDPWGQEEPLEKEMANPHQYSCIENSMDRGAW